MKTLLGLCILTILNLWPASGGETLPRISGRILMKGSRAGIPLATVTLTPVGTTGARTYGASSDVNGLFEISDFPPGEYRLSGSCVGYRSTTREGLRISRTGDIRIDLELEESEILLGEVCVSVGRWNERASAAPVSVSVLTPADLMLRQATTPLGPLKGVAGIDVVEKGVMQHDYVARGLNNVFNGTTLTLTDNRMIGLPSLRANVGYLTPVVPDDIERVEVALGPSSALYGPNATNGVVSVTTRSPFSSQGTSLSFTGGERSLVQAAGRFSGTLGDRFGYKISGSYLRAQDWPQDPAWVPAGTENRAERWGGEVRFDYLIGQDGTLDFSAGLSTAVRALDMTDNGAALARNFRYMYYHGRYSQGKLFAQVYLNLNDAGATSLLETGMPVVDESKKYVGEIQHGVDIGEWQRFIYGGNAYLTRPETGGTIFGRNEDVDNIDEYGVFLQSETRLVPDHLWLIAAARADWHSMLERAVFSPRVGVRYAPSDRHVFRLTYNRAYATPAPADYFLDLRAMDDVFGIPGYPTALRGVGVAKSGLTFERAPGVGLTFHSGFAPDPRMAVPVAGASALWSAAAQIVTAQAPDDTRPLLEQLFAAVPAPAPDQVRGSLGVLNLETGGFDPISDGEVLDVPRLEPMFNQTVEVGYKGGIGDRFQFNIDGYYSRIRNFVTSQQVVTPNVFLNGSDVAAYLLPYLSANPTLPPGMADMLAQQIGEGMGSVPLGTVEPREARDATDILLAPRNAGELSYWGIDLALSLAVWEVMTFSGTYSHISKTYYESLSGFGDLSLNAPGHKASIAVRYAPAGSGFAGEVRYRYVDGFKVRSAVYAGSVSAYGLIDAAISTPVAVVPGAVFTLAASNILDHRHREFVGAPEIGRMVTGRITVNF